MSYLHHIFVPSHRNNYKARALHVDFLTYYLVAAVVLGVFYRALPLSGIGNRILGIATDITIPKLLECTNNNRAENGLSSLSYDEKLADAARRKAADMFSKNYWSHYSPTGQTPWNFIIQAGYNYAFAGENLAKNFLFSDDVCTAWMGSPTHRENMVRPVYRHVGFAVVDGVLEGEETTLVVQMFGAPQGSGGVTTVARATETTQIPTPIVSSPTPQPPPQVVKRPQDQSVILSGEKIGQGRQSRPLINLNILAYNSSRVFLLFLMIALVADLYFAHKLQVVRVGGKHLAHAAFAAFILVGFYILAKGTITAQAAFSVF